jgi:GAF domain-containing protein
LPGPENLGWIERLLQRRHYDVVIVALANKMARTAWAALARSMAFDRSRWNPLEIELA